MAIIPKFDSRQAVATPKIPSHRPTLIPNNIQSVEPINLRFFPLKTPEGLGKVLGDLGDGFFRLAQDQIEMRRANEVAEATAEAQNRLDEARVNITNDNDFETYGERFEEASEQIFGEISERISGDRQTQSLFKQSFLRSQLKGRISIRADTVSRGREVNIVKLQESLNELSKRAVVGDGVDSETAVGLAENNIILASEKGILTPVEAFKTRQEFMEKVESNRARLEILDNAEKAVGSLSDPNNFPNLSETTRIRLLESANSRALADEARRIRLQEKLVREQEKALKALRESTAISMYNEILNETLDEADIQEAADLGQISFSHQRVLIEALKSGPADKDDEDYLLDLTNRINNINNSDDANVIALEIMANTKRLEKDTGMKLLNRAHATARTNHYSKSSRFKEAEKAIERALISTGPFANFDTDERERLSAAKRELYDGLDVNPDLDPLELSDKIIRRYSPRPRNPSSMPRSKYLGTSAVTVENLNRAKINLHKAYESGQADENVVREELKLIDDMLDQIQLNLEYKRINPKVDLGGPG